jgi:hypothetical protein
MIDINMIGLNLTKTPDVTLTPYFNMNGYISAPHVTVVANTTNELDLQLISGY